MYFDQQSICEGYDLVLPSSAVSNVLLGNELETLNLILKIFKLIYAHIRFQPVESIASCSISVPAETHHHAPSLSSCLTIVNQLIGCHAWVVKEDFLLD